MHRAILFLVAGALSAALAAPTSARRAPDLSDLFMVQLRPGTNSARFARDHRVKVIDSVPGRPSFRVRANGRADSAQVVARMRADTRTLIAETDYYMVPPEIRPPPPGMTGAPPPGTEYWNYYSPSLQWTSVFDGSRASLASYTAAAMAAQVGYGASAQRASGAGVVVAVLDTGIAPHPLLRNQLLPGWSFVDNTANTLDVPRRLDSNGNGTHDDAVGHGTMVAGLVSRFAPQARLLPVRVLDSDGMGTIWTAVEGIHYAIARGAHVINLSLAIHQDSDLLEDAVKEAWDRGVVVVASAGNANTTVPQFPAATDRTMTVAAVNPDNTKAPFSNYGRDIVDVAAPGVGLTSTFWDGSFAFWSGTSFSAPVVTAEVALVRSADLRLRGDKAFDLVLETARSLDPWNPDFREQLGRDGGLIDMDAAVNAALTDDSSGSGSG